MAGPKQFFAIFGSGNGFLPNNFRPLIEPVQVFGKFELQMCASIKLSYGAAVSFTE